MTVYTPEEYVKDKSLRRNYGITLEQFNHMLEDQNGCCAICHEHMQRPGLDHNHKTGVNRKLLCSNCNTGLGMFKEDIRLLAAAIVYLEDAQSGL